MSDDEKYRKMHELIHSWTDKESEHPFFYINKALEEKLSIPPKLLEAIKLRFSNEIKDNPDIENQYPFLYESFKKDEK